MKYLHKIILAVILTVGFTACKQNASEEAEEKVLGKTILTTTSLLRDMVENLVDEDFKVVSLMGAGVDPHLYKPTRKDVQMLRDADVIIFNGVHLEGRMGEIKDQLARENIVITASNGLPANKLINNTNFEDGQDPHFWFDISMWVDASSHVAGELKKLYPEKAEIIDSNFIRFAYDLRILHRESMEAIQEIPENRREIITSHDALSYFARLYGFRVRSLQGSSTSAEFGVKDVKEMVDYIVDNDIPSIFPENIVSNQALDALIKGCEKRGYKVRLADELYSDALGDAADGADTFIGMYRANVKTIVKALK
jgi:manganese/zinc/iron transport system substrate-binding protein